MKCAVLGISATTYLLALILSGSSADEALAQSSTLFSTGATASLTMTGFPLQGDSQNDLSFDEPAIAVTQLISALTPGGVLGIAFSTAGAQAGDLGVLVKTEVEGSNNPFGGAGRASATATAIFRDRIVVSSPSLREGDFIDLEADFDIEGKFFVSAREQPMRMIGQILDPGSDADAGGGLGLTATNTPGLIRLEGDALGLSGSSAVLASAHVLKSVTPGQSIDFDISVPSIHVVISAPNNIGTTFVFELGASAFAVAGGTGFAKVNGDFFGSAHWGGISAVKNSATGEILQDWTIISDSGFDYSRPFVPEPASVALLGYVILPLMRSRTRLVCPKR